MTVYQRSKAKFIKSLIIIPLPPFAVGMVLLFIGQYFPQTWFMILTVLIVLGVLAVMLHQTLISDNVRFEISDTGEMNCYEGNKLKHTFDLKNCESGYHHRQYTSGGTQSLRLRITEQNGKMTVLDCEPLGSAKFYEMFEFIQSFSSVEPERL